MWPHYTDEAKEVHSEHLWGLLWGQALSRERRTLIGLIQTTQAAKSIIPRETQPPRYKYSGHLLLS